MRKFEPRLMTGTRRGTTAQSEPRYHAVDANGDGGVYTAALCGARPGVKSEGWAKDTGEAVTCPACLDRFAGGRGRPKRG